MSLRRQISSYNDYSTLSSFLGGAEVFCGKMKETGFTHWLSPNTDATNESGFTAFGGGGDRGGFSHLMDWAIYRTSTKSYYRHAYSRELGSTYVGMSSVSDQEIGSGFSIRCIRP